jgi:proline dehydrogenase
MSVMRSVLLAASESPWLRHQAPRHAFIRRAVKRFMPGERLEDAIDAALALQRSGLGTIFTHLGENVTEAAQADAVTLDYLGVLERVRAAGLDCQISIKPTHLGLDIDQDRCRANLRMLVERARAHGNYVWVDMEQRQYVDATLAVYRQVRGEFPNVGVCLQSYLYRTADDLAALLALGPGIRLVKGAYREPPEAAHPKKADVDASFLTLARTMLGPEAQRAGMIAVFGTHDARLIEAINAHAVSAGVSRAAYEFDLLFGIQRSMQARLVRQGHRVRVLISYGDYWFPWYMRRLAERPANVWFVARSLFTR